MNLLIFSYHQFGLLIDSLKYCEYARNQFRITYLGWDYGKPRVELPHVDVKYVSREGSLVARNIRLLYALHRELKTGKYDVSFFHYTRGISFVRLFHLRKRIVFDIRTLSVDRNPVKRCIDNFFLKLESLFFLNHSVISEGLAKKISFTDFKLLPLGADPMIFERKQKSDHLHLLYVGTLQGRDIIKCVKGVEEYVKATGDSSVRMTIVGDGPELAEIRSYIQQSEHLLQMIVCTGRVPHAELGPFFEKADVGVSFIPITEWYDYQPPTKTFEYLLSGLPVIATNTYENREILEGEESCELISDEVRAFAKAIAGIKEKLKKQPNFNNLPIKYERFSWVNIVTNSFIPIIRGAK